MIIEWVIIFFAAVGIGGVCFFLGQHFATRRCKRVEEDLRASEMRSRVILNAIPDLIFHVAGDGTYIDFKGNDADLAVSPEQIIGNNTKDLLPAPHAKAITTIIEKAIKTGELQVSEYWLPTLSGLVQDFEARIAPAGENEVLVIVRNITEQVHMRKLMIQTEKMMTVGGLAAGMAHEINNPLCGIIQGAQIILQRIDPQFKKNHDAAKALDLDLEKMRLYMEKRKIIDSLDIIRESGNRAAKIVNNMLNFTRRDDSLKSSHNINQLIEDTIELASKDYNLKRHYDFRQIIMKRDFAQGLPEVICAESEIQQVIFNLLKNASQAMNLNAKKEGVAQDYKPEICIQTRREKNDIIIIISDNGPGIPPETKQYLFKPFYTTKKTGAGSGLGLFVSYYIMVNNHNGSISVDSCDGKGATFTLKLPVKHIKNEV